MYTNWIYLRAVTMQYIRCALNHWSFFLKNIDKTEELTELTGMTDCDGLHIVTRVDRANGTEELMDPTELTELLELTEPTELTELRNWRTRLSWRSWQSRQSWESRQKWQNRQKWQLFLAGTIVDRADRCWQRCHGLTGMTSIEELRNIDRYWEDLPTAADRDRI